MDATGPDDRHVDNTPRDTSNSQGDFLPQTDRHAGLVRISRAAIASAVCAFASPACFVIMLFTGLILGRSFLSMMMALTFLYLPGAALILGVIGLASIGFSGGRRTGYAFAVVGISLPLAGAAVLFLTVIPRIRALDHRMACRTNLSGIGKAMLFYANDYEDALPRAGGPSSRWTGRMADWTASNRDAACGLLPDGSGGEVSVSASLYLLMKYTEVSPKLFVCPGDKGTTVFEPAACGTDANMVTLWDFGPNPPQHCSYAYQMVYGPFGLTASGDPNLAIIADRNPWMDSPSGRAKSFAGFHLDVPLVDGTSKQACYGNAVSHQGAGQSVMFLDTHVEFEKRPFCGLDDDNIYTAWNGEDKARGVPPRLGSVPADVRDSLLVNDPINAAK